RPEHMEDAQRERDAPDEQRVSTMVELREDMGPEVYVHFTVEAQPVLTEDTKELAVDRGEEALIELEQLAVVAKTPFVARFHGATAVKEGDRAEVFVDTRALYFFDLDTGESIRDHERS